MRNLLILVLLGSLFSCNNDGAADSDSAPGDTTYITQAPVPAPMEVQPTFKNLIWSPIYDSVKGKVLLKLQRSVNADTLTAEQLIKDINASWDGIKMELRKISHDTIYVAIPESSVLTQQMGSSGAYSYVSSSTFTLTELKNVKYVNYDFVEGDHMAPGTMKRADFKNQ